MALVLCVPLWVLMTSAGASTSPLTVDVDLAWRGSDLPTLRWTLEHGVPLAQQKRTVSRSALLEVHPHVTARIDGGFDVAVDVWHVEGKNRVRVVGPTVSVGEGQARRVVHGTRSRKDLHRLARAVAPHLQVSMAASTSPGPLLGQQLPDIPRDGMASAQWPWPAPAESVLCSPGVTAWVDDQALWTVVAPPRRLAAEGWHCEMQDVYGRPVGEQSGPWTR